MKLPLSRFICFVLLLGAGGALVPAPVCAGPLSGLQRMFDKWGIFQGLQLSGTNNFTFQENTVEGSASAFEGQRWDTDPFMAQTSLSAEGPIWKELQFKADFSATGYGPSYSRWVLGFIGHDTAIYYGDLNIDLSGNQFASFSKPVEGWQVDQKIGRGLARAFYTEEKAVTRSQTIAGNNSSGPFFLTYTPVVQGTEVVKVNEQVQRFGEDYRLDYDSGQLWFEAEGKPPKIIPDTATITVSYQSSGYQASGGTLMGGRLLMPLMGDRLQVGLTMLKQDRGGKGGVRDTVGYQEDIFNGSGSTGPFDVNFRPIIVNGTQAVYQGKQQVINQALIVLVDNQEQVEGVDYDSYRQIGRIIFRRSVPPTALVVIRYFYDLSLNVAATNNQITGVDLIYHFTPKLNLAAEWGKSDGGQASNSGDALRLNLSYTTDKLKAVGEYRDISPTFSFLDSVGFYRQDKGLDVGVNYQVAEHVSLYARRSDLKTSQGYSFGYSPYGSSSGSYYSMQTRQAADDTTTGLDVHSVRDDFEVRLEYPKWPSFAFQRQQLANSGGSGGDSAYDSNNFTMNWSPTGKPFTLSANLYQTNQTYAALESTDTSSSSRGSKTEQFQWAASYRPSDKLSLSYNQGRNRSEAIGSADRSTSSTDQLALHWTPSSKIDINVDRTFTTSFGSVSSGLYGGDYGGGTGSGIGGGGGIIDDGDEDDDTSENRYRDDSSRLSVRYSPSQKLSFDFSLSQRDYTSGGSVGYLADSSQTTKSVSAMYQLSDALSFNATWGDDQMAFLEEGRGTVSNRMITVGTNYRKPNSPWGLALSLNKTDGTSPTYTGYGSNQQMRIVANNMTDMQARLTYALSEDSELALTGQISDYAGGYANFDKQQLEVGYRKRVSSSSDLTFGYRFVRNVSGLPPDPRYGHTSLTGGDQNYLANTFLLTVSTQFSSGSDGGSRGFGGGYGGFGGQSLGNFGGYRAGGSFGGSTYYGTGYGGSFQNLGVFGQTSGSGFTSPFGGTGSYGTGGYGSSGYGNTRPQGYETFGSSFRGGGTTSGFTSGLGDVSGGRPGGDPGEVGPRPTAGGTPAAQEQLLEMQDWLDLDDMYSIWW